MRTYQSQTLIRDDLSFADFAALFGQAMAAGAEDAWLLIRKDGARLEVVQANRQLMLCFADASDCRVSYASSYVDSKQEFRGLLTTCVAKVENFLDPSFAIPAVRAFFDGTRMSEFVDFRIGRPDPAILEFPEPMTVKPRIERQLIEQRVNVPAELRDDMRAVCEYLDEVASDPDENIDFDDAIQIGSLCGGRIDQRRDKYLFSYYLASGDVWSFEVPRTILEGIADGSITTLKVTASIPK